MTLRVPPWLLVVAGLVATAVWSAWTGAEAVLVPLIVFLLLAALVGLWALLRLAASALLHGGPGRWSWSQRWRDPLVLLGVALALVVLVAEVNIESQEVTVERGADVATALRAFVAAQGRMPGDLAELERHAGRTLPGPSIGSSFRWDDDGGTVHVHVVPRRGFPWTLGK